MSPPGEEERSGPRAGCYGDPFPSMLSSQLERKEQQTHTSDLKWDLCPGDCAGGCVGIETEGMGKGSRGK